MRSIAEIDRDHEGMGEACERHSHGCTYPACECDRSKRIIPNVRRVGTIGHVAPPGFGPATDAARGVAAVPMADLPGMARVAAMRHALTALEHAHAGLNWYGDRYPEAKDGSDDEAAELIAAAIEGLRGALAAGVTACDSKQEKNHGN
jgi:hypothetical protein